MPIEPRFDDLDLREEPARGDSEANVAITVATFTCNKTRICTPLCCTTI